MAQSTPNWRPTIGIIWISALVEVNEKLVLYGVVVKEEYLTCKCRCSQDDVLITVLVQAGKFKPCRLGVMMDIARSERIADLHRFWIHETTQTP